MEGKPQHTHRTYCTRYPKHCHCRCCSAHIVWSAESRCTCISPRHSFFASFLFIDILKYIRSWSIHSLVPLFPPSLYPFLSHSLLFAVNWNGQCRLNARTVDRWHSTAETKSFFARIAWAIRLFFRRLFMLFIIMNLSCEIKLFFLYIFDEFCRFFNFRIQQESGFDLKLYCFFILIQEMSLKVREMELAASC